MSQSGHSPEGGIGPGRAEPVEGAVGRLETHRTHRAASGLWTVAPQPSPRKYSRGTSAAERLQGTRDATATDVAAASQAIRDSPSTVSMPARIDGLPRL